jgi:RNA polymerase sigma-70 factor, ECF subfamily
VDGEMMALHLTDQRVVLHRYVARLLGPQAPHAEDVVQEALLRAWQHRDTLDWRERPIRQWLFRIARNIVIDEWRKDRMVPVGLAADVFPDRTGGDPADVVPDRLLLLAGMRSIPAGHREILGHVHLMGRSGDDVAGRLRIPAGTVKSRTHGAVRALRRALGGDEAPCSGVAA